MYRVEKRIRFPLAIFVKLAYNKKSTWLQWCTGWFKGNGTVQNTDADVLGNIFCVTGNLWNHIKYSHINFDNLIIFRYQYWCLFRQGQSAKYMHLKFSLDHDISWYFSNNAKYFCVKIFFKICRYDLCLVFEIIFNYKGFPMA